jgi:hypothetical protein
MRAPRGSSVTSSTNLPTAATISTGHKQIRSSSVASSPKPTPRSQVSFPNLVFSYE